MPHLPGLDGLRGLAVIGVLLFHGGFTWARGGYLGVSTFFTLSGFLITNLLVREFDVRSTIALGRFWVRRFRRLLPAALVTIGIVGLVWWRVGSPEQLANLRGDMIGSLAYLANWRFLTAGTSYADLFSAPSPLQHFWSLAIEEQFYLFFPPIVWGLMKVGGRRLLTAALVVGLVASVGIELALHQQFDRVYYGTDTRAAELLFGCLLAVWWSGRRGPAPTTEPIADGADLDATTTSATTHLPADADARASLDRAVTALADLAGAVALVAVFWAWWRVPQSSSRLVEGGLPLYAVCTTVIIYAATRGGLVSRALSIPALRWAGLISYGLYLYHWPIFLLIDEDRTGLSTLPLFVVRMAVTTAIAVVSYFVLEQPIRRGTMIRTGRQLLVAGLVGAGVVASTAFVVTLDPPRSTIAFGDATIGDVDPTVVTTPPSGGTTVAPTAQTANTVMILGDSGMVSMMPGLTAALQATGTSSVIEAAGPGFGLSGPFSWREDWAQNIADQDPDVVVMMLGGWDGKFVRENGVDAYRAIVDEAVGVLTAGGAKILWLPVMPGGKSTPPEMVPVNEVFAELPARYPGVVANPTVGGVLADASGEYPRYLQNDDGSWLVLRGADGWHLCQDGAERMSQAIVDALVQLGWSSPATPGWQTASWRQLAQYDDPPGSCDAPSGTS
jgi:peptidoglycan/LPS O-acetylase OafA/YrhL/lysophospholipase L1-like esterase